MSGNTILITGASKGIGKAIALEMAQPNNRLILTWSTDKVVYFASESLSP